MKKYLAILIVGMMSVSANARTMSYLAPSDSANWAVRSSRVICVMKQKIPDYGIAIFSQRATKKPRFMLTSWQPITRPLIAKLSAKYPVWKPYSRRWSVSRVKMYPGRYPINFTGNLPVKLLSLLDRGLQPGFSYHSPVGYGVKVQLSPVNFQKSYAKYMQCLGNLLDYTLKDVELTMVFFSPDEYRLPPSATTRLMRVREYVLADRSIQEVAITGYTDGRGRRSYNNAIAELRAKAVRAFLVSKGVPSHRISMTWKGVAKPIGNNKTRFGRAQNRRVEIQLFKYRKVR